MTQTSISDFKSHLREYLNRAHNGEVITILVHQVPIATLVHPLCSLIQNKTRLGRGAGSVRVHADLTEPAMDPKDWEMLKA